MARTAEFASGAERATTELHSREGAAWTRNPETGHGTSGNPMPSSYVEPQQHLFDPGQHSDIPFHAMSPTQFAASPHVWWHGRYGEDLPSDSYVEDSGSSGEWADEVDEDKEGYHGIHFGTRQAALDRLKSLGPGRPQSEDEDYQLSRDPGTPTVGGQPRIPGRLFPVTLNHEQFRPEMASDMGENEKWRREMGYEEPSPKGVFYQNRAEDVGSVSAAVPKRESSIRSMASRSSAFFNSWNDHVLAADPDTVHPALRWAAQQGVEHTGEDYLHPDDQKQMAETVHPQQGHLFQPYGADILHRPSPAYGTSDSLKMPANTKFLDENFKNTIGSISTVPHKKDKP